MSRIVKNMTLDQTFGFGKFMGRTLEYAIEKNAKEVLRMRNLGYFIMDEESVEYLKEQLL